MVMMGRLFVIYVVRMLPPWILLSDISVVIHHVVIEGVIEGIDIKYDSPDGKSVNGDRGCVKAVEVHSGSNRGGAGAERPLGKKE